MAPQGGLRSPGLLRFAGMVEAEEETIWFTDQESISKFDEDIEDADEGEE